MGVTVTRDGGQQVFALSGLALSCLLQQRPAAKRSRAAFFFQVTDSTMLIRKETRGRTIGMAKLLLHSSSSTDEEFRCSCQQLRPVRGANPLNSEGMPRSAGLTTGFLKVWPRDCLYEKRERPRGKEALRAR